MSKSVMAPSAPPGRVGASIIRQRSLYLSTALAAVLSGLGAVHEATAQSVETTGVNNITPSPNPTAAWSPNTLVRIGDHAQGSLIIKDGGRYSNSGDDQIGYQADGSVVVSGTGSVWENTGEAFIGVSSGQGTLRIEEGGAGEFNRLYFSFGLGGGTGIVTGQDSRLAVNELHVASNPLYRAWLTVDDGGLLSTTTAYVAGGPSGVTVSGADALWRNAGAIYLGYSTTTGPPAQSAFLVVNRGGRVEAGEIALGQKANLGVTTPAFGTLIIGAEEGQSALAAGTLETSLIRTGGFAGAIVFNHTGAAGSEFRLGADLQGAIALRQLAGTTLLNGDASAVTGVASVSGGRLIVANQLGGTISVTGGALEITGQVRSAGASRIDYVGADPHAVARVLVSGAGATWADGDDFGIGVTGRGQLTVVDGAVVTVRGVPGQGWGIAATVGANPGAVGSILVSGANSRLSLAVAPDFLIGTYGVGALTLSDGGAVGAENRAVSAYLGAAASGQGTINIGAAAGQTPVGAGALELRRIGFGDGLGVVNFNHTDAGYIFSTPLENFGTGTHRLHHQSGVTQLTADSSTFAGVTAVEGGRLVVAGELGGSAVVSGGRLQTDGTFNGDVAVSGLGAASGAGEITGDLRFSNGGELAGQQGQTFRIGGDLALADSSRIALSLGAAPANALFDVGGDLTLDGRLDVSDRGGFGAGVYRLFDYAGALHDKGLEIGATPAGVVGDHLQIQTSSAGQINLVSTAGMALAFWDGDAGVGRGNLRIDGGDGVWSAAGRNWTGLDGALNGPLQPTSTFAVLQGAAGTLQVDGSAGAISVAGIQFAVDGYRIEGDAIELAGPGAQSIIRVGDGTPAGAGVSAKIASELTGAGQLVKADHGTLILTGANTYGGGVEVREGALIGDTGSIRGDIANAGTVVFDQASDAAYGGMISGAGRFVKAGHGHLRFTGDSSAFAGAAEVAAGTLSVDGKIGGALNVLADARLQGRGTVGRLAVAGVIAPGASIGVLKIAGDVRFEIGSTYEVEVDAAGQADRIEAAGAAKIAGGSVKVLAGQGVYAPSTRYTILTAEGGRVGSFLGATSNLAFLIPILSYDPTNVYLTLVRSDVDFSDIGQTRNQIAVGRRAEDFGLGHPVHDALLVLAADKARNAFDQLSGEIHASAKTALVEDSRHVRDIANERTRAALGAVAATSPSASAYGDGLALWGGSGGAWGRTGGDGNAAPLEQSTGGLLIGADAPVAGDSRVGVLVGYSRANFKLKDRRSSGTSDDYHLGFYGGLQRGDLGARAGLTHTWRRAAIGRVIAFPDVSESLRSEYGARAFQAYADLGYRIDAQAAALEPFANLAYVGLSTADFAEQGGDGALHAQGQDTSTAFATVGLRAATDLAFGSVDLAARGSLGWRRAAGDTVPRSIQAFSVGEPFAIAGAPIAKDAAVIEAGLLLKFKSSGTLGLSYDSQVAREARRQALRAEFTLRF